LKYVNPRDLTLNRYSCRWPRDPIIATLYIPSLISGRVTHVGSEWLVRKTGVTHISTDGGNSVIFIKDHPDFDSIDFLCVPFNTILSRWEEIRRDVRDEGFLDTLIGHMHYRLINSDTLAFTIDSKYLVKDYK
jgi:hypothetical protein